MYHGAVLNQMKKYSLSFSFLCLSPSLYLQFMLLSACSFCHHSCYDRFPICLPQVFVLGKPGLMPSPFYSTFSPTDSQLCSLFSSWSLADHVSVIPPCGFSSLTFLSSVDSTSRCFQFCTLCHDCITGETLKIAHCFDPTAKGRDGISDSRKLLVVAVGAQSAQRQEWASGLDIRAESY